jgi:RimJ/RimL family protein N-acetyltransferase
MPLLADRGRHYFWPMDENGIRLAPVTDELRPAVLALAPRPEQAPFSGVAAQTLPDAERTPGRHPVAILDRGLPVGFMILDRGGGAPARTGDLLLRAFFVDATRQGRGIGSAALRALPAYARAYDPDAARIVLTVNIVNPNAQAVYERSGFADTGELYHGGQLGPQRVLAMALVDQPSASL